METLELFKRKLDYNCWANLRALESLRSTEAPCRKATSVLTDVLLVEKLWLARLRREDTGKVPSDFFRKVPTLGFEALIEESFTNYQAYLETLTETQLDSVGYFETTDGGTFELSIRDVLTHVFNQSSYHRGQLALAVGEEGGEPQPSDYTRFLRESGNIGLELHSSMSN